MKIPNYYGLILSFFISFFLRSETFNFKSVLRKELRHKFNNPFENVDIKSKIANLALIASFILNDPTSSLARPGFNYFSIIRSYK